MQAKIDTLTMKNGSEEYMLYPRTLIKCITNENGDDLDTTLKGYIAENVEPILEETIGDTYVKNETFTSTTNDLQADIDNKVSNTTTINDKTLDANIVLTAEDVGADVSGAATEALASANSYTDQKIDTLNTSLTSHTGNTTVHITAAERTAWNAKANGTHTHTKSQITDFPTSMTPTAHNHNASDITAGTLPVARGGTGATTAAAAMQALAPTHFTSPAFVYAMGSNGYTGGSGYATIAELKTAMALNNVNNTADSAKSVKYATSAGSANAVAWGNVSGKPSTFTPASHNQAASTITAGTLAGAVVANATAVANIGTKQTRNIYAGTTDMTAGTSALPAGDIYVFFE